MAQYVVLPGWDVDWSSILVKLRFVDVNDACHVDFKELHSEEGRGGSFPILLLCYCGHPCSYAPPTGHGRTIIARSSPSWRARLPIGTTTSLASTPGRHVIAPAPADVPSPPTSVRSTATVAQTARIVSLAAVVGRDPATLNIAPASWLYESATLTSVTSVGQVGHLHTNVSANEVFRLLLQRSISEFGACTLTREYRVCGFAGIGILDVGVQQ